MNTIMKLRSVPGLLFLIFAGYMIRSLGFAGRDSDDLIREIQIRDLLADNQWTDMALPGIAMPEPYYSPWSRLVDAPYYLITRIFEPFFGVDKAFSIAKFSVPLLLLLIFSALLFRAVSYLKQSEFAWTGMVLTVVALPLVLIEFSPGRIDHHNFQIVFMAMMCVGLLSPGKYSGLWIGIAALLSVVVGMETLPFIALAFAGISLAGVLADEKFQDKMKYSGWGLLVLALPLALIFTGLDGLRSTQCDAYSAPWVAGAMLGGGALMAVTRLWQSGYFNGNHAIWKRMASLIVGGTIPAALLALLFPTCLAGPYAIIDPVTQKYWLQSITQEKPFVFVSGHGSPVIGLFFWTSFVIALAALLNIKSLFKAKNTGAMIILALGIFGLILTGLQMRFYKFPAVFLCLFIPYICTDIVNSRRTNQGILPLAGKLLPVWISIALFLGLPHLIPAKQQRVSAAIAMNSISCKQADFSILSRIPAGKIMAPPGLSQTIFLQNTDHTVANLQQHRAAPGLKRSYETFLGLGDKNRRDALRDFDYVAVCKMSGENLQRINTIDPQEAPFFLVLVNGKSWPGLMEIEPDSSANFRIFKLDHSQLK